MGFSIDCIVALNKALASVLFMSPSASSRSCSKSRRCIHVNVVVFVVAVLVVVEEAVSSFPPSFPDDDDDEDDAVMPRTRDSWNALVG